MAVEMNTVIQEVVVDDSQATAGAARVTAAMESMAAASDQATAATARQATGFAALDAAIAQATPAQTSAQRALERWTAAADPAVAAQQRLARAEADLSRAVQQGIATEAQKAQVLEQLSGRYAANVAANENLTRSAAGLAASNATVTQGWNLNRQGLLSLQASGVNAFQALASGMAPWRVAQMEGAQVLGALVQGGVKLTALINPLTIGIAALTAGIGFGAAAWAAYDGAVKEANFVLEGTGRAAGITFGQLEDGARVTAEAANISTIAARTMAVEFGRSGKIGADQFQALTILAKNYVATVGGDLDGAVKALAKDFSDPAEGADRLNDQLHFLDDRTRQYIVTLDGVNGRSEAQRLLAEKLNPVLADQETKVGLLGRAWRAAADAASDFWEAAGRKISEAFGTPEATPDFLQNLKAAQLQMQLSGRAEALVSTPAGRTERFTSETIVAEIARVEAALDKVSEAAEEARRNEISVLGGAAARSALPEFSKDSSVQLDAVRKKLAEVNDALADPSVRDRAADYAQLKGAQDALNHALDTYIPPADKARQLDELAVKALQARTPAERAAVAEAQKRIELSGQVITAADAENQVIRAGTLARTGQAVAARNQMIALKGETDGTLAVAAAYGVSTDAVMKAQAAAQAHSAWLQNAAVNEKALTQALYDQAKANQELAAAQELRTAKQATAIAASRAQAAPLTGIQERHDAELAIDRQQKLNELTNKYGEDLEKINGLMGEFDHQQALNDQTRFWDDSRQLAKGYADDVKNFLLDGLTGVRNQGESIFKSLWDAAEQGLKRFLINAALTAAENAIVVPVLTQVVGSLGTGITGIAQASGGAQSLGGQPGGAGVLDFLGLGNSLANASGVGLFSGLGTAIDAFGAGAFGLSAGLSGTGASMSAAMAGPEAIGSVGILGGTTLSSLLGGVGLGFGAGTLLNSLLGGNSTGGMIGSGVGALGGAIVGSIFPVVGTVIGGLLGGLLGGGVGGLFGNNNPSVGPNASGNARFVNGTFQFTGGGSDNGGSVAGIAQALGGVASAVNQIIAKLGATVGPTNNQGEISFTNFPSQGGLSGLAFGSGGTGRIGFADVQTAQEQLTIAALQSVARQGGLQGVSDAIVTAMKNSVATKLEDFASDIDFAKSLDDTIKGLADANDQFSQVANSAKAAALSTTQQLTDLKTRADALGLGGQGAQAIQSVIDSLLNFTAQPEQISATEQALAAIQGHFAGLKDALAQFGVTAEQIDAAQAAALAQTRQGFNDTITAQIEGITDPLQAALDAFDKAAQQRVDDATKLGADLVAVERLNGLQRQQVIEQANQQATNGLRDFFNEITFGKTSGAAPGASLEGARATFQAAAAQALAGDATAQGRIQQLGQSLLDSSRGFYASGAGFQHDLDLVRSVVGQLIGVNDNGSAGVVAAINNSGSQTAQLLAQILNELSDLRAAYQQVLLQNQQFVSQLSRLAA